MRVHNLSINLSKKLHNLISSFFVFFWFLSRSVISKIALISSPFPALYLRFHSCNTHVILSHRLISRNIRRKYLFHPYPYEREHTNMSSGEWDRPVKLSRSAVRTSCARQVFRGNVACHVRRSPLPLFSKNTQPFSLFRGRTAFWRPHGFHPKVAHIKFLLLSQNKGNK